MAIDARQLGEIEAALVEARGPVAIAELRRATGLTVSQCDASDLGLEPPFRGYANYDLYLVDGRDHCWRLTDDPGCATGVMIARKAGR